MQAMTSAETAGVNAAGASHPVLDFFLRRLTPEQRTTVDAAIKGGFPWSQILNLLLTVGIPALLQILQQWLNGLHPTPPSPLPPTPVPPAPKP